MSIICDSADINPQILSNLSGIDSLSAQKHVLGEIPDLTLCHGTDRIVFQITGLLWSSWDLVSWIGVCIFWDFIPIPRRARCVRGKSCPLSGDFFEELKKTVKKSWKSLDFTLSEHYHPIFLPSKLKIYAGRTWTFQYIPMTVPQATGIIPKLSETRSQLKFVATEVFRNPNRRFTKGSGCNLDFFEIEHRIQWISSKTTKINTTHSNSQHFIDKTQVWNPRSGAKRLLR